MARTDSEQLVVTLEARIRDFEKKFAQANRTATKNFTAIESRAAKSATILERSMNKAASGVSNAFKGFAAGAIGGFALDKMVRTMADTAKQVANIGNEAKRAGLSNRAFQELGFVAEQNRIPVDALIDGMKELNLRADEFATTGKGSAAEAFTRLGFKATELKQKLKDPSALLIDIIKRMESIDKAAQIRIADEIFGGTGGERFVELLARGSSEIENQIKLANELGIILNDEMIEKADEIDRKFQIITKTIGTKLKAAIIDATTGLASFIDRYNDIGEQSDLNVQKRLAEIYRKADSLKSVLEDQKRLNASMNSPVGEMNIKQTKDEIEALTKEALQLRDILDRRNGYDEGFIYKAGKDSKETKPEIERLNATLDQSGTSSATGALGINSYADAIRALKNEVPELAAELAKLDAQTQIDSTYRSALNKARTMGEVMLANSLHNDARAALASKGAREAASKSFLDLIGYAEGTDKGRGYNETLGYGAFTGGNKNLVLMSLDEIDALQGQMLAHPNNKFNSSALGRYQIVRKTLRGLRGEMGLDGSEQFTPELQDRLAQQLMRRRGNDVGGLRNEWEGLRRIDPSMINKAYDGQSTAMPAIDNGILEKRQALADTAREQATAYQQIIQGSRQFTAEQNLEQQALTMTAQQAAALRYEQDMLNQAQQAGIALTPQQRAELHTLALGMAEVEAATVKAGASQQQLQAVQGFLSQSIGGFLQGIITGSMSAEDALKQLVAQLAQAALQAALFGQGPFGALFGGGSGILGALFGMKTGGPVLAAATGGKIKGAGNGTSDSIPAMLSDGEYVINAKSTRKHGRLIAAINADAIPAFADGGLASAKAMPSPNLNSTGTSKNGAAVTINAPVAVNASGGTPAQNADLARQMSEQMEATMRGVVVSELRTQMRAGNMLSR